MATPITPDIAIIGMACRVAGSKSPSELWEKLLTGNDVQRRITRFNIDGYYYPKGGPLKGLTNVDHAYMLDDHVVDKFDNAFFHVTPTEAASMDPQQRMLLEVSYEAIENAGIPLNQFTGTDTAVFTGTLGIEGSDYHTILARDPDTTPKYIVTGTAGCMASNRLSYFYDLSGPSVTVDTACSSSMAALHQAVRTLQHGDSSMALVCGANLIFNVESFITMTELGFLSSSGTCRSFDANGDGYGRGEGICCVLLAQLDHALSIEAPVRAVIKGTRLNQDGRTQGITLPSAKAQAENMSSLYSELDIESHSIQYLEAHGTGTPAGDPLEMQAVKDVYQQHPLVVSSTKGNVGHCEAASALVGIIKTVLCLEHQQIPAQMHFSTLNPSINLTNTNITIPKEVLPWPKPSSDPNCKPRAAINTFGAGGTNGHAVLESFAHDQSEVPATKRPWLFRVSAANETSLRSLTRSYGEYIEKRGPNLRDLAHTLLAHRSSFKFSHFFVASTYGSLLDQLRSDSAVVSKIGNVTRRLLLVFTGQGAQWQVSSDLAPRPRMGCSLLDQNPLFRSTLLECNRVLQELPYPPAWSILDELSKTRDQSNIDQAQYSQPLCTALQIGLVMLLKSWGLQIAAVVGHSSGEIGAAFAAGMISLRDAIVIAYYRGLVLAGSSHSLCTTQPEGAMCAVDMSGDECKSLLKDHNGRVQVAAENSAQSRTLSGNCDAIDEIIDFCNKRGSFCRRLKVDKAYHSHHMLPLSCRYDMYLQDAQVGSTQDEPDCVMFSSVTGRMIEKHDLTPSYWAKNMTSTVQYAAAINSCLDKFPDLDCILEIGPHPALKSPTQTMLSARHKNDISHIGTCRRDIDDFESILRSAGELLVAGVPLRYQWNHSASFWSESRVSRNLRNRQFPRHELLGSRYVDDIPSRACWRNNINIDDIEWLEELGAYDKQGLTSAICVLMAIEAARQIFMPVDGRKPAVRLTDMKFPGNLLFSAFSGRERHFEVQLLSKMEDGASRMTFEILRSSPNVDGVWQLCSSGTLALASEQPEVPNDDQGIAHHEPLLAVRARSLTPDVFKMVKNVQIQCGKVTGDVLRLENSWQTYPIHPVTLASVLSLAPTCMVGQNLLVKHCISSIPGLTISVDWKTSDPLRLAINTHSTIAGDFESQIHVSHGKHGLLGGTLQYTAAEILPAKPITSSLFFKSVSLPDITKCTGTGDMSIEDCVQLLTHKWPMSDIFIKNANPKLGKRILGAFNAGTPGNRKRFRSILVAGEEEEVENPGSLDSVRYRGEIRPDLQAHMIVVDRVDSVEWLHEHLRPTGLLCVCGVQEVMTNDFYKRFDYLCGLTDNDRHNIGHLWRIKDGLSTPKLKTRRIIFCNRNFELNDSLQIPLAPEEIRAFTSLNTSDGRLNAILIDDLERSIITTWPGKDLIPWLQHLMRQADSLLWVTPNASSSPFVDVAGTLLRTLQAEQPSLKVSWLCLNQNQTDEIKLMKSIKLAYTSMMQGENEVKLDMDGRGARIIRYLPDEDIAAATGVALPREVDSPIDGRDYELTLAAARAPVVLSYDPAAQQSEQQTLDDDDLSEVDLSEVDSDSSECGRVKAKVQVQASVINSDDIAQYNGQIENRVSTHGGKTATTALGTFFAGKALTHATTASRRTSVMGWTEGTCANIVMVKDDRLIPIGDQAPVQALTRFAALGTAMAVLEGHIRARKHDLVHLINLGTVLRQAFHVVCQFLSVEAIRDDERPNFTIEASKTGELLVNGVPVNIHKNLAVCQDTLIKLMRDLDRDRWFHFPTPKCFALKDYKEAFKAAIESRDLVVLNHDDLDGISHVPIYRPPTHLLTPQGAYIIIGGLGGLGRYTCSWLVEHGVKSLYAISRSGLSSPEAQALYNNINSKPGITLKVIQADACNRPQISSILSSIRTKEPIKGIINMAMVLGDAPMASMTGEEWDRALRVKIESSWIAHEETKGDELEAFVLFSSIASVLGNRNQGSYNVGNTFLNALVVARRREGRTAVAVALGAMSILSTHSTPSTAQTLTRSGLTHLTTAHLSKILEAAFYKSRQQLAGRETCPEDAVTVTGLEMWDDRKGKGNSEGAKDEVYWRSCPEFSHLASYHPPSPLNNQQQQTDIPLKNKISGILALNKDDKTSTGGQDKARKEVEAVVRDAFLGFLSRTLGFAAETFDEGQGLRVYGLDSLSA
ncbi:MAG: hypothetical protein Q9205_005077, partial [Flavoplaca limonia]